MLYIVECSDKRLYDLFKLCSGNIEVVYSNKVLSNLKITQIFLPLDGLDEFGYVKGTTLKLEDLLLKNKIWRIFTGVKNNYLMRLAKKYDFNVFSFYDNESFLANEVLIKLNVIRFFLIEKTNMCFENLNILVVGNDSLAHLFSRKLYCSIYEKPINNINLNEYDAIINFSINEIDEGFQNIIIEMNELQNLNLETLLGNKEIYLINNLLKQYLTKSSAKILYDCMVKN